MPPLTLAILASVLHMHGADAAITSDNKGIEDVLAAVRGRLEEQADPKPPSVIEARKRTFNRALYLKSVYAKIYTRHYVTSPARKQGGASVKAPGGHMHR